MGILFVETKKLFVGVDKRYIQHDPIIDHPDFYQTNLLFKQLWEYKSQLQELLPKEDFDILRDHIEHMHHVLNSLNTIQRKMYGLSDFYFVYKESTTFTDRGDFQKAFEPQKMIYLSHHNDNYEHLIESHSDECQNPDLIDKEDENTGC